MFKLQVPLVVVPRLMHSQCSMRWQCFTLGRHHNSSCLPEQGLIAQKHIVTPLQNSFGVTPAERQASKWACRLSTSATSCSLAARCLASAICCCTSLCWRMRSVMPAASDRPCRALMGCSCSSTPCSLVASAQTQGARYSACVQLLFLHSALDAHLIAMRHDGFYRLWSVCCVRWVGAQKSKVNGGTFRSAMSVSLSCLLVYLPQRLEATAQRV